MPRKRKAKEDGIDAEKAEENRKNKSAFRLKNDMNENPVGLDKMQNDGFRNLKCTLSRAEFGLVRWAQSRAPNVGFAQFMRRSLSLSPLSDH